MKKRLTIFLTALLMCLTVGLFACADETPDGGDGGENPPAPATQYTYTSTCDEGVTLSASAGGVPR